ncbi:hypothetical protein DS832_07795 [Bombilactobacillus bombi]|uniref:Uncharacterized protein n=1 Tax=Bombilactobacillus bombi TaxID=1303590 RepID=A0A3R6VFV6_9LACO|nr:hypothetical protein [Bombilactobacillus bombi]RHW45418.1 hypothetical protein DS832_07795 [Bombilactobacillus bombi]
MNKKKEQEKILNTIIHKADDQIIAGHFGDTKTSERLIISNTGSITGWLINPIDHTIRHEHGTFGNYLFPIYWVNNSKVKVKDILITLPKKFT